MPRGKTAHPSDKRIGNAVGCGLMAVMANWMQLLSGSTQTFAAAVAAEKCSYGFGVLLAKVLRSTLWPSRVQASQA